VAKVNDRKPQSGQVMIPKNIREKFGLMPYIEVEFVLEETGVLKSSTDQ
jgi:bifunctional DNA-binding transcriptional regulator/antitoxin component of YhaV-PrlF toxin-antitoxin module